MPWPGRSAAGASHPWLRNWRPRKRVMGGGSPPPQPHHHPYNHTAIPHTTPPPIQAYSHAAMQPYHIPHSTLHSTTHPVVGFLFNPDWNGGRWDGGPNFLSAPSLPEECPLPECCPARLDGESLTLPSGHFLWHRTPLPLLQSCPAREPIGRIAPHPLELGGLFGLDGTDPSRLTADGAD